MLKDLITTAKLISLVGENYNVSEEEYSHWKEHYEALPEHEKVFALLGVVTQYLLAPDSHSAAGCLGNAIVCTSRWCEEKDINDF